jgi:hypothetical protein
MTLIDVIINRLHCIEAHVHSRQREVALQSMLPLRALPWQRNPEIP